MPEKMEPETPDKRVMEDVLDEVLSFNYRSLRTFRGVFVRPARIAECFINGDRETYTPTMRVWFGLLSWMFLLSVIWGGFTAIMFRVRDDASGLLTLLGEFNRDVPALLASFDTYATLFYVPFNAAFILPGYLLVRYFRPDLTRAQSVQCYFVPVTALLTASIINLLVSSQWPSLLALAPLLNYIVFAVTAWRVIRPHFSTSMFQAVRRTGLMTLMVFLLSTTGTILTVFAATGLAIITTPPLVPVSG